jgi:N-methylhydantoinase B
MATLADGLGQAEGGLYNGPYAGVISGIDPRTGGSPFVNQLHLAYTGGAGTPKIDGWLTTLHPGNGGMLMKDSVEVDELLYPILVKEIRLLVDTEGAGYRRGTPSVRVEYEPVETTMLVIFNSDGTEFPARGVRGGGNGHPAEQFKRLISGELIRVENCGRILLQPGESIVGICSSGGGYGSPYLRELEFVQHDVMEGWISKKQAKEVYGVVLNDAYQIDLAETKKMRNKLKTGYSEK